MSAEWVCVQEGGGQEEGTGAATRHPVCGARAISGCQPAAQPSRQAPPLTCMVWASCCALIALSSGCAAPASEAPRSLSRPQPRRDRWYAARTAAVGCAAGRCGSSAPAYAPTQAASGCTPRAASERPRRARLGAE